MPRMALTAVAFSSRAVARVFRCEETSAKQAPGSRTSRRRRAPVDGQPGLHAHRRTGAMYDIYRSTADDACRFALGRSGRRRLVVVGLNPSTATREKSDPTVAKVAAYLEEIHASPRTRGSMLLPPDRETCVLPASNGRHENTDQNRNKPPGRTGRHHGAGSRRRPRDRHPRRARRPLRPGCDGGAHDPGELGRQRTEGRRGLLQRLVPRGVWRHDEQDGNGDAHIKAGLVGPSETIPLIDGRAGSVHVAGDLLLRVRRAASSRTVVCTVLADPTSR